MHKIRIIKNTVLGWPGLPRVVQPGEVYDVNERQRDVLVNSGYAEDYGKTSRVPAKRKKPAKTGVLGGADGAQSAE